LIKFTIGKEIQEIIETQEGETTKAISSMEWLFLAGNKLIVQAFRGN